MARLHALSGNRWTFKAGTKHVPHVTLRNNTDRTFRNCIMYVGTKEMGNIKQGFDIPPGEGVYSIENPDNPVAETPGEYDCDVAVWDSDYNELLPRTTVGTIVAT